MAAVGEGPPRSSDPIGAEGLTHHLIEAIAGLDPALVFAGMAAGRDLTNLMGAIPILHTPPSEDCDVQIWSFFIHLG